MKIGYTRDTFNRLTLAILFIEAIQIKNKSFKLLRAELSKYLKKLEKL